MELPAPDGLPRWYPRSPAAAGSGGLRAAAVWNVATAARLRRTQPAPGLPDVLAWPARRHGHGGQLCALYPPCDHGGQGRADRWTSKAAAQQGCSHTDRPWTFTAHPYWGCGRPQPCLNDHRSAFVLVRPVWSPPPESNRRPHPYHGTTRNRCAEPRFPRSRPTVRAEVMGSPSPKLCAHSPVMPCRGRSAGTGTRRSQTMKAPGQLPARKALPGSDGRVNGRRRARRYGRLTAPSPLAGGANVVFSRPLRGGLVDLRPWSYVGGVADSGRIPRGFAPPAVVPWPLGRRSAGGPARSSP